MTLIWFKHVYNHVGMLVPRDPWSLNWTEWSAKTVIPKNCSQAMNTVLPIAQNGCVKSATWSRHMDMLQQFGPPIKMGVDPVYPLCRTTTGHAQLQLWHLVRQQLKIWIFTPKERVPTLKFAIIDFIHTTLCNQVDNNIHSVVVIRNHILKFSLNALKKMNYHHIGVTH